MRRPPWRGSRKSRFPIWNPLMNAALRFGKVRQGWEISGWSRRISRLAPIVCAILRSQATAVTSTHSPIAPIAALATRLFRTSHTTARPPRCRRFRMCAACAAEYHNPPIVDFMPSPTLAQFAGRRFRRPPKKFAHWLTMGLISCHQGDWRLPPGLRCRERRRRAPASRTQAARR